MRRIATRTAWLLAAVALVALAGCGGPETRPVVTGPPNSTGAGSDAPGTQVLMTGRSVMAGWFEHWGAGGAGEVTREGFTLRYAELASPPDLGSSAAAAIAQAPEGGIVFFKPCFVDFWASTPAEVDDNVDELVGFAQEAVAGAEARGCTIILGTALPKVATETNESLVEAHRRYGDALRRLAAESEGVVVFDLNAVLAADDGSLPSRYALGGDDSHLTRAAYEALDAEFFPLLESLR